MKNPKTRDTPQASWQTIAYQVLSGTFLALGSVILLLLLVAFALSHEQLRQDQMEGSVLACCLVASLIGSLFVVTKHQKNGLLLGITTGASFFLLLFTLGLLCFPGATSSSPLSILFACLCGGGVAKFLRNKKKKNH